MKTTRSKHINQVELEHANQHFEARHIYTVDVLDLLTSRNVEWKLGPKGEDGLRDIITTETKSYPAMIIPQELPAYLRHSLSYIKEGKRRGSLGGKR